MQAKLVVVRGKTNKSQIALKLPTIIGRSREADLTVGHPMVSRQHCELFERDGLLMIRDLSSLNGTLVEGQRIQEVALLPGAEFTVGPLAFRVEYEYTGQRAAIPPGSNVSPEVEQEVPQLKSVASQQTVAETRAAADLETVPASPPGIAQPAEETSRDSFPVLVPPGGQPAVAPADGQVPDFAAWQEAAAGVSPAEGGVELRAAAEEESQPVPGPSIWNLAAEETFAKPADAQAASDSEELHQGQASPPSVPSMEDLAMEELAAEKAAEQSPTKSARKPRTHRSKDSPAAQPPAEINEDEISNFLRGLE